MECVSVKGTGPRFLIADDHAMFAEALRVYLEKTYPVAGVVMDGRTMVMEAMRLQSRAWKRVRTSSRYSPRDSPSSAALFFEGTLRQASRIWQVWGLVFEELADALDYNHETSGFRHDCGH
jgi:hypothetical protein